MGQKLNILVIDDKKVIGDLFDFTLGYSGHAITVVDNAKAALDAVGARKFDVVFLDIVMPDKDGTEVLQDLKKAAPNLPVIMMSGYSVEDKKKKAQELGAVTCLKKPFEIDDVKAVVKEVLGVEI
ncbi:MAG TPA: response regulator [Candidatus Omnitrophota bacterium]|nr:response regulator [Candidatus Omnitrophota bacterium]HPD84809.1 response regulator [Candidatus Omnitrophota bacterium]HRZ03667.1 response regulator [Candidatus Omnitrophota bacterium]